MLLKFSTGAFFSEELAMALAMGCSELASTEAAYLRSVSSSMSWESTSVSVTPKRPSVSVPVLSKMTACSFLAPSNETRLRMSRPFFAASAVETATTSGTARPKACGQAMTITVTVRSMANAKSLPMRTSQTKRVITPPPKATIVSHRAAVLARSWVFDLLSWACLTRSMTCDKNESLPAPLTSIVSEPSPLMDPPRTFPPVALGAGVDSPVSIASLTELSPSTMTPSAGIFSPGLISTLSLAASSPRGTSFTLPSGMNLWASEGMSLASSSQAREAPITDFISIQCPSNMMSMSEASSQKNILPDRPNTTALLYRYAVAMATQMSVIIPTWRDLSSPTNPVRKGHPPYQKTAEEKPKRTYMSPGKRTDSRMPTSVWSIGDRIRIGSVRPSEIQNRFWKSAAM